jgi:hypothetical protein
VASVQLFYGPGARDAAMREASQLGRMVAPPQGDDGLRIDAKDDAAENLGSRQILTLLKSIPVGGAQGTLVIGPMDDTRSVESMDCLLKTLEENECPVLPVLWAEDIGGVQKTIRSRCIERWCPDAPADENADEEASLEAAGKAIEAALTDDPGTLTAVVRSLGAGLDRKSVKRRIRFLRAVADLLSTDLANGPSRRLWERVRPVTRWRNPVLTEILTAMLPEV